MDDFSMIVDYLVTFLKNTLSYKNMAMKIFQNYAIFRFVAAHDIHQNNNKPNHYNNPRLCYKYF